MPWNNPEGFNVDNKGNNIKNPMDYESSNRQQVCRIPLYGDRGRYCVSEGVHFLLKIHGLFYVDSDALTVKGLHTGPFMLPA